MTAPEHLEHDEEPPGAATSDPLAGAGESPPLRRRRRLLVLVSAGVGLALLLAAAVVVAALAHPSKVRTGAAASASPAGSPLSPDAYQQAVTDLDRDLAPMVQAVTAATSYVSAAAALSQLQAKVDADAAALDKNLPPAAVRIAHQHLVKAVHELATDAGIGATQAHRQLVCVGGAALADLSQSTGGVWLRAAAKELATADPSRAYHAGGFIPDPMSNSDRRLANGTMLKKPGRSGANDVKIANTGTIDAVVAIVPQGSNTATLTVYVRGGGTYTVTGIPDGTYQAYALSGKDWDGGAHTFARYCHQERADGTVSLTSNRSSYTDGTLTISPSTSQFYADGLDPDTFPR